MAVSSIEAKTFHTAKWTSWWSCAWRNNRRLRSNKSRCLVPVFSLLLPMPLVSTASRILPQCALQTKAITFLGLSAFLALASRSPATHEGENCVWARSWLWPPLLSLSTWHVQPDKIFHVPEMYRISCSDRDHYFISSSYDFFTGKTARETQCTFIKPKLKL